MVRYDASLFGVEPQSSSINFSFPFSCKMNNLPSLHTPLAKRQTMALNSYFATLKLETGVRKIAVVQDRAVCTPKCPEKKKAKSSRQSLKDTLRTAATKFSIDECDEPLYCPQRQLSSSTEVSSSVQRSSGGLELDDSFRYQWETSS